MKNQTHNVVIVAHPDDETLFFGGLILSGYKEEWSIIVVTDANADGMGAKRTEQLKLACKSLGVERVIQWDLPDRYEERLSQSKIRKKLTEYHTQYPEITHVYTHGPAGEYTHPHHQDVSLAVHEYFLNLAPKSRPEVWSVAYNSYPQKIIELKKEIFERKREILMGPYRDEVARFMHLLPCTWSEGFHQLGLEECETVKNVILNGKLPAQEEIVSRSPNYQEYLIHLESLYLNPPRRPF